jgi:hypothetical protein
MVYLQQLFSYIRLRNNALEATGGYFVNPSRPGHFRTYVILDEPLSAAWNSRRPVRRAPR